MANVFSVSIPNTEKDLIKWIEERKKNGEISPSVVFHHALVQKKREWDMANSTSPIVLHKRIDMQKEILGKFNQFIDEEKINQRWFDFQEKLDKEKQAKPKNQELKKAGII